MAVKRAEVKGAGKNGAAKGSDQEKGLARVVISFEEFVQKSIEEQLAEIVYCVLVNVSELHHLPSAKLLIELATLIRSGKEIPGKTFEAFAENLRSQFLLPAETGSEKELNEQQSQGENTPVTD